MPRNAHRDEIEIKLRVQDLDAVRARLRGLRARKVSSRTYERNTLYDTPEEGLRRRGQLIRIRVEHPAASAGEVPRKMTPSVILTFKGPSRSERQAGKPERRTSGRRFKIKAEIEVSVSREAEMAAILEVLGLRPAFHYEKFRTTYVLQGVPGLKIELDETPVGNFLELEGSRRGIDRVARLLGYRATEYIPDSYGALYLAECRRRGQKPSHMLFSPTKKSRERSLFS